MLSQGLDSQQLILLFQMGIVYGAIQVVDIVMEFIYGSDLCSQFFPHPLTLYNFPAFQFSLLLRKILGFLSQSLLCLRELFSGLSMTVLFGL